MIEIQDEDVIRPIDKPLMERAGFVQLLKGNLFDAVLMKTSVILASFRKSFENKGREGIFRI